MPGEIRLAGADARNRIWLSPRHFAVQVWEGMVETSGRVSPGTVGVARYLTTVHSGTMFHEVTD